ncbi:hypothetical protein A9Q87_08990 [Flavobacteriales bacterium 34_180_T64]|nr:hypothetical protein A9Q87_08990 [Flavobacteriales bacterium 34_180_T64]
MKISNILFAVATVTIFTLTSCKDSKSNSETTEENGHEHDADGNHKEEVVNQEEFNVNGASETTEEQVADSEQTNEATIVVKAHKALEYKFKMNQYEKLEYEWKSDAALHYDFHGDPDDKDSYLKGYFESYAIGNSNNVKGKITIPYKGSHGWYWKNESGKDITITLSTKGNYNIIGILQ